MDLALVENAPETVTRLSQVVLRRLPRNLATYERILRATWLAKRWDEGEDWGRRLLQADPGNALAWRALARAAEQRGARAQANAMWRRAFEMSPYDPDIRAGLGRTSLEASTALALNLACLGALYLHGLRWERAAAVYRSLVRADSRRIDFQVSWALALWQARRADDAYALARHLVRTHAHLLLAWVILDATGDENDKALARNPIESMDPNGEFVNGTVGMKVVQHDTVIAVGPEDAELLQTVHIQ